MDLGNRKIEGPFHPRRQCHLRAVMEYYEDEARKYLAGFVVGAGTAWLTAGIGATLPYKLAILDQIIGQSSKARLAQFEEFRTSLNDWRGGSRYLDHA